VTFLAHGFCKHWYLVSQFIVASENKHYGGGVILSKPREEEEITAQNPTQETDDTLRILLVSMILSDQDVVSIEEISILLLLSEKVAFPWHKNQIFLEKKSFVLPPPSIKI
jgi:hypothetical protein